MPTFAFTLCPNVAVSFLTAISWATYSHIQKAASKQEASSNNNGKKGLAVDIKIPRDRIGSDHIEKPAQNHRRFTQWYCQGANRTAAEWYLSLSWASDRSAHLRDSYELRGLKPDAAFKTETFYWAHAGVSRDLELPILAQIVSSRNNKHSLWLHQYISREQIIWERKMQSRLNYTSFLLCREQLCVAPDFCYWYSTATREFCMQKEEGFLTCHRKVTCYKTSCLNKSYNKYSICIPGNSRRNTLETSNRIIASYYYHFAFAVYSPSLHVQLECIATPQGPGKPIYLSD